MTLAELEANERFGGAQLVPGVFHLELTPGLVRQYEWNNGDPNSLIDADETGQHYLLREIVGAGACNFVQLESRSDDPNVRVHAIVTPDSQVIGTLITRLVTPDDQPRTMYDRVARVADKITGFGYWFMTGDWVGSGPELHIRVRPSPLWNEA